MKGAALLSLMIATFPIRTFGQELVSTLSLTAEAGYLTNTYLHPVLPLWVAADAPFVGLAPSAGIAWLGTRSYAGIEGRLRFTQLTDHEEVWWLGSTEARLNRQIGSMAAIGVDASASRIEMDVQQWLAWGGPYMTLRIGRSVRLAARFGASHRQYDAVGDFDASSQLSYFTVAQVSITSGSRWSVLGHAYAAHSTSQAPDPRGVGSTIRYAWTTDLSTGLQISAERFGPAMSNWQSAAFIDWQSSPHLSWSGRFGMQQFVGEAEISPDVFAALGITYRLRGRRDLSRPQLTWKQDGSAVTLRYIYAGDGILYLVGDFNDWRIGETKLHHNEGLLYTATMTLPAGRYEYKIVAVVNGAQRWLQLPDDVLTTDDQFGGTNGILLVE